MEIVSVKTEERETKPGANAPETAPGFNVPALVAELEETPRRPRGRSLRRPGAVIPALALCFTLLLGVLTLALPKRGFSETENRVLAEPPAFSFASLWNGSLFSAWENYFTDHFAGRDAFLRLHALAQFAMGKRELGGVYVGQAGHLFLVPAAPEEEDLRKKAAAVNAFAAAHENINCVFALAPNAVSVQAEYLPQNAPATDQQAQIAAFYNRLKNVKTADLYSPLAAHAEEYLYYLTDHHWTSRGAGYAFEALRAALELPGETNGEYVRAGAGFRGTLSGKSGSKSLA